MCFVRDLKTKCSDVEEPAGAWISLQPFDLLRVEGPEHGPATARPSDLEELEQGRLRMTVARKARLRLTGLPEAAVALSLYTVDDPEARRPAFRYELAGVDPLRELFIPAGNHLASLTRRGGAPDLHVLSAPPGGTKALRYHDRTGWSLALRTIAPEDGGPVSRSKVHLTAPPVVAPVSAELPEAETGALGFALFCGLTTPMVHATVRHPEFVDGEALGLSSSPGSFDLYHAVLERGGTIDVRVTVDGASPSGATCRLVELAGTDDRRNPIIETLQEVQADASGLCRIERVAEGKRFVRVVLDGRESAAAVDRDVYVVDGETVELEVDLTSIQLSGMVYRGEERAGAGYGIHVGPLISTGPGGTRDPSLSLVTDESGEFSGMLWTPGRYILVLTTPEGGAVGTRKPFLSEPTEEVDFHLSAREVRGHVVDPDGEPVEAAAVRLSWNNRFHTSTRTDSQGVFRFSLNDDEGEARLSVGWPVQEPGGSASLSISPGVPIPPVTLTLREPPRIDGRLLSSLGPPVPGGRVWSYRGSSTGAPTQLGSDTTQHDGSFAVPQAADAPTWIYASGPGCPLSLHALPPLGEGEVAELRCPDAASALRLHMLGADGDGLAGRKLILRQDGTVIPSEVLEGHLASLGLPAGSDGRGRLVLAGVPPGEYDLYLRDSSNEATVAQGLRYGFVTTTTLQPLAATDLEIVVEGVQ